MKVVTLFIIFLLIGIQALAAGKVKPSCLEGAESKFFRHMGEKYFQFVKQTRVLGLPYTIEQGQALLKTLCIVASEKQLAIDDEFKDAINYPERKFIELYKPTWESYRAQFAMQDWNIENYYKMFRIFHHEIVPFFIKKSDPKYETSLLLYNFMTPFVSPSSFEGEWIYVQKSPSPMFGHYLGQNCAITINFDATPGRQFTNESFLYDHFVLTLGSQNPLSKVECLDFLDIWQLGPKAKYLETPISNFSIFCNRKDNTEDWKRMGEFYKYSPITCATIWSNIGIPTIDYNLKAWVAVQLDLLANNEVKVTYNFHRDSIEKPLFSFSNTYAPYKKISIERKWNTEQKKEFLRIFEMDIRRYPLQKWIYANKFPTVEQNCEYAKSFVLEHLEHQCVSWLNRFKSYAEDPVFKSQRHNDRILFSLGASYKNLSCPQETTHTWEVKVPSDNGCIAIGERMILNDLKK